MPERIRCEGDAAFAVVALGDLQWVTREDILDLGRCCAMSHAAAHHDTGSGAPKSAASTVQPGDAVQLYGLKVSDHALV